MRNENGLPSIVHTIRKSLHYENNNIDHQNKITIREHGLPTYIESMTEIGTL